MKGNEEEHLVRALKTQIELDREVEDLKKSLSLKIDFNLLDAFRVFDYKGSGYTSKYELESAFNTIGVYPTKEELHLFFKRYDRDTDGLLKYSEFCKCILPQSSEYASLMNNRIPHYNKDEEGI